MMEQGIHLQGWKRAEKNLDKKFEYAYYAQKFLGAIEYYKDAKKEFHNLGYPG